MPNTSMAAKAAHQQAPALYAPGLTASESRTVYRALSIVKKAIVQHGVAMSTPYAVRDYLKLELALEEREVFVCVWLDSQNRVVEAERMFVGTLAQTSVHPREIVKAALKHNAAAVILDHNHPSGHHDPSPADMTLTSELKRVLALVDVRVLDHFIVAGDAIPVSFAEHGIAPFGDRWGLPSGRVSSETTTARQRKTKTRAQVVA